MKMIFIILFIFIYNLYANEKSNVSLQLSWLNQFQFAGYYVAKEKGFYKDVGLEVNIREFKNNTNLTEQVINNEIDFAIGRSSLLIDKIKGNDIVALAAIFQSSPLMLLSTNSENIKTIEDMKNKEVMITMDAELTASITAMLNSNGVYMKDLVVKEHSFNVQDLINKKVDLMASYVSNEPIILEEKNIPYKIFHPKNYGFDFYDDILFTSSEFIKQNPITTQNFYEATIKGWEYAFKNKTEVAEIIFKKYNTQNKSLIHLIKEAEALEKLAINNDGKIGCLDEKNLEKMVDVFKVLGLIKEDLNFDSFIYEHNHHKKIIFEISHEKKDFLILVMIFITVIFILILYFLNKLHNRRNLLSAVINTSDDLIYYKDHKLKYIGCNDAFEKFVNKSKKEIIGKNDFELFENKYAQIFKENDLKVLESKEMSIDNEWLEINNKTLLFQSKRRPLKYEDSIRMGILGVNRDITNLFEIQKELEEQAIIDELTKAYNRKSFNEKVNERIELFKRYENYFCMALLDIDNFKVVNDTYGHDIGDKVLIKVSQIIKQNIRTTDTLFRIGGEEFIILYPKTLLDEAFSSAEKIRILIEKENIIENHPITISIGLAQINENDNKDTIFKRVDDLMYISKKNGKNKISVE